MENDFSFKQLSDNSFDTLKEALNEAKMVSAHLYPDRAIFVIQLEENTQYDWSVEPENDGFNFYVLYNGNIVNFK